ncbi:ABC transporter ATP-binding protein [Phenylobacterium montanum]|uniref:ABC transporter ATP-binding protein n=1 Tax=Phenylobacterium montanum TaxID=2823693 RepID=A0A975IVN1_9CAUL|nr:ABC transporter ATP-binding protein [Caulobacter sp. S6]QUD87511.1 ABC transporter ATP-binding protein [Caulobacter sp. S6]
MIVVRGVAYDYPTARVLHQVSFEVAEGAVLALVGPNGAGKTTLLRCMAALDAPAEGRIAIAGLDTQADPRGVHAALGYLPDFYGLYDQLSVAQSLVYAARSRGVAAGEARGAAEAAAGRVQLSDRMDQLAGHLSRGLRQRLAIAQALVHRPRVLLLDEPAAGLDPEARRSLSDLIRRLSGEGMTIVVSSHILAELEDYSTRMLMLREGRIAGGGVVSAHGPAAEAELVAVELAAPREGLAELLSGLGLVPEGLTPSAFRLRLAGGPEAEAGLLARLVAAGLKVRAFVPQRPTLEQTYLDQARAAPDPGEPQP